MVRMNSSSLPHLALKGVSKSFLRRDGALIEVLRDFSLDLMDGEILSIVGPSGCGKTTLLNLIAGLSTPDAGTITFASPSARSSVGFVFQQPRLLLWRSALENVAIAARSSVDHTECTRVAIAALERVGLGPIAQEFPSQMSEGERQRVSLARALAVSPKLLLLDEPFSNLDAVTGLRLKELLIRLWELDRFSAVFVTHSPRDALTVGHRVVILTSKPAQIAKVIESPQKKGLDMFAPEILEAEAEVYGYLTDPSRRGGE